MPALLVVLEGDTFASVWADLAKELGLELRVVPEPGQAQARPDQLPPILVVAGREQKAEADVRRILAAGLPPPIAIGMEGDHRLAVRLMQAGAAEYLVLPGDHSALRSLVADHAARSDRLAARAHLLDATRRDYDFSRIIGRSPGINEAIDRAARIIPHERANVLITGETGTGKELIARAIHHNGPRADGAFVEINCAAIPGNLLESELFGYERGAFTDARTAKPGLFEAADGGTLFLDEIGHMSVAVQGKLLKAIEEKRVRRLGSLHPREVDLRVIAATHVDLAALVDEGGFREDLYYRLAIIPIHLPPLRERGEDVLLLAGYFLASLAEEHGLPAPPLDDSLRRILLAHSWPGNVRELRNTLERGMLLGSGTIDPQHLFFSRRAPRQTTASGIPFPATLAAIEKHAAQAMVARFEGNKSAAAEALQISRSRLYRLLDDGEEPPQAPRPPAGGVS